MFTTFSAWVDLLFKAAGHKYIRRIPYSSGGRTRYRYIYKVTHTAGGKHALHEDDVTVGAAFMLGTDKGSEVHAHVKSVDGDKVTVEYDDGPRKGEKETMSKRDLLRKLDAAHGISQALQSEREKQAKVISELRASGASEKQIAREQARLDRLGAAQSTRQTSVPRSERPTAEVAKPTPPAKGKTEAKPERLRTEAVQIGDRTFRLFPQLSHGGWGFYMSNDTLRAVHLTGDYKGQTRNVAEDMSRAKLEEWLKDPRFQVALSKLDHNDPRGTGMYNLEQLMHHGHPFGVGFIPGTSPNDFLPTQATRPTGVQTRQVSPPPARTKTETPTPPESKPERQTAEVAKPTPPAKGKTEAKPERLRTEAVQIGDRTFRLFPQLSHGGWGFYMSNDTLRAVHLTGDYKGQTRSVAEDMTRAKLEEWLKDPRFQVALSKLDHNDPRGTGMYNLEQLMFHSRPFGVGPIPGTSPNDFRPT